MSERRAVAFNPLDLPESNRSTLPEPYGSGNRSRANRRLGDHAGLTNYGVNLTRVLPGGQSSYRHAHSKQDEFVYVLEGEAVLETDNGEQVMRAGMCIGFPAGTGEAHRFLNRTEADVLLLVIGDRTQGDEVSYPEIDLHGRYGPDGRFRFTRKDGTPYD